MSDLQQLPIMKPREGAEVDIASLAAIADAHAFEVWGHEVAHGDAVPVAGLAGDVRAFVFPYIIGANAFPSAESLATLQADPKIRFGTIYVAAGLTEHPVLGVAHALHPLFVNRKQAEAVGRSLLGPEAQLTRIYWFGLHQEYFELATPNRRILLEVHTLKEVEPEAALHLCPTEPMIDLRIPREPPVRPAPPVPAVVAPVLKLVPFDQCVPTVNWTWWCVPTAFTMATCYYDNFIKGIGGNLGYGRLVGYWFDHPKSGHNVPDFIDQLIDPATGTWRAGFTGFPDFIQKTYGYNFSLRNVDANQVNDFAWADITAEIDVGQTCVWSVPNHATCALGYRITAKGEKFVVIHTTWGDTDAVQRQEWLYTMGTGMGAITAGGGTPGQDAALWVPSGGETFLSNVPANIQWYVWGDKITRAELSFSSDGGNTWTNVAHGVVCTPGWNNFSWKPLFVTGNGRIRIQCYDAAGVYIAGDGSHANFKVLQGPRPVTLRTILINAKTDAKGFFSAQHGLQPYGSDSDVIRSISVSVQHKNGNWHTLEMSNAVDNRFWWNKDVVEGIVNSPNFFEQPVQIVVFAETVVG